MLIEREDEGEGEGEEEEMVLLSRPRPGQAEGDWEGGGGSVVSVSVMLFEGIEGMISPCEERKLIMSGDMVVLALKVVGGCWLIDICAIGTVTWKMLLNIGGIEGIEGMCA